MLTVWTHQLDCQHDMSFCQFACIVFLCGMWFLWNPSHIPFVIFSSVFSICAFLLIHALCHARTVFTKTFGHWAHPPPLTSNLCLVLISFCTFHNKSLSTFCKFFWKNDNSLDTSTSLSTSHAPFPVHMHSSPLQCTIAKNLASVSQWRLWNPSQVKSTSPLFENLV